MVYSVLEKTKKHKAIDMAHIPFQACLALLLLVVFARNVFAWPLPVSVILGIAALCAILGDRSEIVTLAICFIPLSAAFQYKYAILVCLVVYAVKYYRDIRISPLFLPLLGMMIWELLHAFGVSFSIAEWLRDFAELILLVFLSSVVFKKMRYAVLCRSFALCCIITMTIVLLNLLKANNYDFSGIFDGFYRFGIGNMDVEHYGVNYNPNALGRISNLALCGLLQLVLCKKHRPADYILMLLLVFFGILTMSRSFLVCLLFLLLSFFVSNGMSRKAKKYVFFVLLALALSVFLLNKIVPEVITRYWERFQVDDITNGRSFLFAFYNEHLVSNWEHLLFGLGVQGMPQRLAALYGDVNVSHNAIQELLIVWGIPGLCMFLVFLFGLIRFSWRKEQGKRKLIHFMPLILLLIAIQSGQMITSGITLLELVFAYVSMRTVFGEDSNELC